VSGKLVGIATLPLVPVTVTRELPMYVEALYAAVSVSVALPEVAMEAVESWPVTPAGNPPTVSVTVPVNPFTGDTLTV
jgi:hypothetical protein